MQQTARLTEEQRLLAETAGNFFREHSPPSRVRQLRDSADAAGFSWELWKSMAELGWVACHMPEEHGGAGLGFLELCLVLEAAGRTLAPEPLLSTSLLASEVLQRSGNATLQRRLMPEIARGECVVSVAYQERKSRYDARRVETLARRDGDAFRVSGEKIQVLDGHVARALIVSANTENGIGLFVLEAPAPGLTITRQHRIDGRNAALVRLDDVRVSEADLAGDVDVLEGALERAAIGLAFEMLGSATRAFELTLEHLKARRQFGVAIGSFQALQHRAARLYIELSLARAAALAAARAVDQSSEELPRLASLAKARCSDTFVLVANEAVQMHGGIGVTDEHDIGLYLKRARAADVTFGDAAWHRERWAALGGY
jgi:acyl-CoA dehydrogenase